MTNEQEAVLLNEAQEVFQDTVLAREQLVLDV